MKANKKILSLAVAAALSGASVGAHAVVTLSGTVTPVKFATELPTTGLDLLAAGATQSDIAFSAVPTTFTPSTGQNLQVTVDLTNGAKFKGNPSLTCIVSAANGTAFATTAVLNLGGDAASQAVFTVSTGTIDASVGSAVLALSSACTVSLSAGGVTVASGAHSNINASITYQYGTLSSSTVSGNIITFAKGVSAYITAGTNLIAAVATGFTTFSGATTAALGMVYYAGNGLARLDSTATTISALDVMTAAAASITLAGAAGALAAAKTGGVYLVSGGDNCVTAAVLASANGAASVTLGSTAGVLAGQLATAGYQACLTVNGTTAIPADSITAAVTANSTNTGYTADTAIAANTLLTITRDGSTLVAPLVQAPAGWLSRLVITNAGASAAAYTVSALGETGNTLTLTGAAASGTVPANGVTIVDLPALMTATGTVRGSLVATVAGTSGNISGVYQIVNPTGNLSNYTMINK